MEPVLTNWTITPPPLWKLEEQGHTKEINVIIQALNFFENHPDWTQNHQEECRSYCSLLDRTHFTSDQINQMTDTAWKTYAMLFTKYPYLFSLQQPGAKQITITTTGQKEGTHILKNHLLMLSNKFRKMLSSAMKEDNTDAIELRAHPDNEGAFKIFLKYIATGELPLNGDNVIDLLILSDEHDIEVLRQQCLLFIKENLDLSQLPDLLRVSLDLHLPDLTWLCLSQGMKHGKALINEKALSDANIDKYEEKVKE
ncbi:MAG TPA: BTB/POZ domain-containing protein, partial [Chlamydiales bacterium]|nr:BTB/POZ domain-containing protein [Chlamydiales bacterium]